MSADFIERQGLVCLVAARGRIDAANAGGFSAGLEAILEREGPRILLDMSELAYTSSGGLRVFLALAKKAKQAGGELRFCRMTEGVQSIFKMAGFTKILAIYDTREAALADFG